MLRTVSFTFIFLIAPFIMNSQTQWELKKQGDNIKIYTRSLPNKPFDEYKATTVLSTPISIVLDELLMAPQYYEGCEPGISYYVKQLKEHQHVFYAHKALPWPIKDRDIVTLLTVDRIDGETIKLTLESLPEEIPEKNKTIRVKSVMGYWLLEEMNGKTKVTQQLFVDPEGTLPPFIVNGLLIKGPYKTFKDLQKLENSEKLTS